MLQQTALEAGSLESAMAFPALVYALKVRSQGHIRGNDGSWILQRPVSPGCPVAGLDDII